MGYMCVQCGFRIKTLFVQYSPGNIRLMKCENCKEVADQYIECETMILLIDLILHKPKAYRHLLYNVLKQESPHFEGFWWKSAIGYLLLDAYRTLVIESSETEWGLSMSFSSLVWTCRKMFTDVFLGNFLFLSTFVLAMKILLTRSVGTARYKDILLAMLISSYFKIFLIAMMVWEFPSSAIFIIDLFVLSSNTMAVKGFWLASLKDHLYPIGAGLFCSSQPSTVSGLHSYSCKRIFLLASPCLVVFIVIPVMTEAAMSRCIGVCFSAHAVKLLTSQLL